MTIQAHPRILRLFACLVCATLAACESSAPTHRPEPAEVVETIKAATVIAEDDQPTLAEFANRLIDSACERRTDSLCAIQTLAILSAGLADPQASAAKAIGPIPAGDKPPTRTERQALHDRLWRLTGALTQAQVLTMAQEPLGQLRAAMSSSRSDHEQTLALREWMERWPAHPFSGLLPTSLARLPAAHRKPARVGLFVPLSGGALAAAGRAARDGYIAAWLDDPAPNKAPLRVYDTAAKPMRELYEQSLADGIELIVGPLGKQRLEALRGLHPEVAVLGLNYLDALTWPAHCTDDTAGNVDAGLACAAAGQTPLGAPAISQNPTNLINGAPPASQSPAGADHRHGPKFLQVGLAIEDEAATIVNRLQAEGLRRLIAVHGREDWAVRGARALADAWPDAIEVQEFADVKTLTESIGGAMQIAASIKRKEALAALLNRRLEFLPRRRADIDGVVAFVTPIEASALAPALKFHFAGDLPVYASSLSVRNATGLDALNGFQVAAMPLNLYSDPLWQTVKTVFGKGDGNIAALQALGMDAYQIASLWDWVARAEPIYGATGELRLGARGQVRRSLAWARVTASGLTR